MFLVFLFTFCIVKNTRVDALEIYTNENNNLITIPTEVPSNVTILNLKKNKLQEVRQGSLDQFIDLEEIYLTSNLIETLENNVFNPTVHLNLTVISLGDNSITEMPELHGFQMLRILNLSDNQLQTITTGRLDNLKELILNGNELHSIPVLSEELSSLRKILLQDNKIVSISPDYFIKTPGLKILDLSRNSLQKINLDSVKALTEIRLSHNNLSTIPLLTQTLTSLTIMVLNNNSVSSIPEDYFVNTPALLHLNLIQTKLREFNCTRLNRLRYLYLDNTLLAEFPNITNCFTSLRLLRMKYIGGHFTVPGIDKALVFGSSLTPKRTPYLNTFHARGTPMGDIPDWFLYALPNLQNMDIASTMLTEMPDVSTNKRYVERYLAITITGYIQTELMTLCLDRKHLKIEHFREIFNFYIYVSVHNHTIKNYGRYLICEVCNLKNIVTKL